MNPYVTFILALFATSLIRMPSTSAQATMDAASIASMIAQYKKDPRGPYRDIRWFCPDGTTLPPQERCSELGGVQRARYKEDVIKLANTNHIFLGQILSTTGFEAFWDMQNANSRLKQYQLEQFLKSADKGWVNRRAQFYRGAVQAEDEDKWGIDFLEWALTNDEIIRHNYFLLRQSARDIPHMVDNKVSQRIRAVSKEIAEELPSFMDLRVKIHGNPERSDIASVRSFKAANKSSLTPELQVKFDKLIGDMENLYRPFTAADIRLVAGKLSQGSEAASVIGQFGEKYESANTAKQHIALIAEASVSIRELIIKAGTVSRDRLILLDLSNNLESDMILESPDWTATELGALLEKTRLLANASYGFGYLERWEWEQVANYLVMPDQSDMALGELDTYADFIRRTVDWGTAMARANYEDVVQTFVEFEPLAAGFLDDLVRSSVLLPLGNAAGRLGDFVASSAGFENEVMALSDPSAIRGLNAGYAMGKVIVTNQPVNDLEISSNNIYIFSRPPADLKPVAGIATVTEGNVVSHVQLLARNLGIPNAVLTDKSLHELLPHSGEEVFYAVSNEGTVVLKPKGNMTPAERALFVTKDRTVDKIEIDTARMRLDTRTILNLRDVNASQSGILCGPKAANLGQLKRLFPENVVEGLVIPFGVFREHMDQPMPGENCSYWEFLNELFQSASERKASGESDGAVEQYVVDQLQVLRAAIREMTLSQELRDDLKARFTTVFGRPLGQVPVFLRSDTNMEDLKDFTGAGLNLTLFNVLDADKIIQGILDVWASPYTERSYKWRQRYLLNPENVFPSILIIPSVNADHSGVLITKGVTSGSENDLTVAFNRGVGGAVEGQASETWIISDDRNILLSPAREPEFTVIPETGGTTRGSATFEERILSDENLEDLKRISSQVRNKLPETGVTGPYDIELGFKDDHIWLFQVRPFVENKKASASQYLQSITPPLNAQKQIPLNSSVQ